MHKTHATQRELTELSWKSGKTYADPFNEVDLDVVFKTGSTQWRVPAFWSGGSEWRVRFAPPVPGEYEFETACSDKNNPDLHGKNGSMTAKPYAGSNPILVHGGLRTSANRRYFEFEDKTPFFWLGDTWWMGFTERLRWPHDFEALTADRVTKGFTVIQIIAGLYPDMPAFDERGANEAGFPWEKDYSRINPAWFDKADARVAHLVRSGLMPCIVGCWGYFLPWMGVEKLKKHWRYMIARWGSYPVTWCLAGEAAMPYYLSVNREADRQKQKKGWTEIADYVRKLDPLHRPLTIHPTDNSRDQVEQPGLLDYEMLQTGHSDRYSIPDHVGTVIESFAREPRMPTLVSEVCYEGIHTACHEEVQRCLFWMAILSGTCGHTYGANGIWQVNTREEPYGPSPHGMAWGNTPWDEAAKLPGSANLALSKQFLSRFDWWRMEPHPEWIHPQWTKNNYTGGYCAGVPGEFRIAYLPRCTFGTVTLKSIEKGVRYAAYLVDPATNMEHPLPPVEPDADGNWNLQKEAGPGEPMKIALPLFQDWLIVMKKK